MSIMIITGIIFGLNVGVAIYVTNPITVACSIVTLCMFIVNVAIFLKT